MPERAPAEGPTTIVLVRHGDVHNPEDIVYGRLPRFRLSEIGREEAARAAAALSDEPVAAIYSSPRLRARQTAAAIAARHPGVRVRISSLLDEVRTSWQGTSNPEMERQHYNFYDPPREQADETLADVTARMMRWFRLVLKRHPGQVVVGVSHGDPTMIPRVLFGGVEPSPEALRNRDLYPQKGSITRFVFHATGDPLDLRPEVHHDDPSRAAREEREAALKASTSEPTARPTTRSCSC